jgi:acetyl esterase/lipase
MSPLFASLLCLVVLSLTLSVAQGQTPEPLKPTQLNVPYGTHERQVLDFYQAPSEQPTPLLFFIHGGGWMNGDKANPDFVANYLKAGISVVSINYRLIPDVTAAGINPPVKACLEDAARALQLVRSKAKEWNLDPQRVCGCGGSAGGFSTLWLAFHDEMADPKSADPIARESTRLQAALTFVPQTSLDPLQMRQWIPNNEYGNHAFALASYQEFLDKREQLQSYIFEFSPYALASSDDPPVYLFYDTPFVMGQPAKDPPHSANFGGGLAERLKTVGVEYEFVYAGGPPVKHPDLFEFVKEKLKVTPVK